jgi:HEAT repeat protein
MRTKLICSLIVWLSPCHLVTLPPCHWSTAQAFDKVIDSPMYWSPKLLAKRAVTVYVAFPDLWLKALKRPEEDLNCKAADAIAVAHRHGVKGMKSTIGALIAVLDRKDQHPTVRLAVARALITLEARGAAPNLFRHAQAGGSDLKAIVEPALARWNYQPARAVWLKRLRETASPHWSLVLAIRGLATVREPSAAEGLRALVVGGRVAGSIRLEAARALALLGTKGLEKDADKLAADKSLRGIPARLAAASLLQHHKGERTIRILQRLARDDEAAVAAAAVARLIEIDPKLVAPELDHLLTRPDAKLRSLAVEVLRREPTEKRIRLLCDRLDDPDPAVRVKARQSLVELAAKKDLEKWVIEGGMRVLSADQWRGLEQATIQLVQLHHEDAADRLVTLLKFDRPEVYITAAWGLRKLAVPKTLAGVLSYVKAKQKQLRAGAGAPDYTFVLFDHQLSQLNQFLGEQKYKPAGKVLPAFIPRMEKPMMANLCPESRAAAIWALGLIHKGEEVAALVTALEGRLKDPSNMPPEVPQVRSMSAISLGRMKSRTALNTLRDHYPDRKPSFDPVNNACGWAIEQITKKGMPRPETIEIKQRIGFLTPDK